MLLVERANKTREGKFRPRPRLATSKNVFRILCMMAVLGAIQYHHHIAILQWLVVVATCELPLQIGKSQREPPTAGGHAGFIQ